MQVHEQRYLNRISNVLAFVDNNAAKLAAVTRVGTLKTQLIAQQNDIVAKAQAQGEHAGAATQTVVLKVQLLDAVRHDLEDMARVAKVMDVSDPGIAAKFQLPHSNGEQAVLNAARIFAANATPQAIQDEFISYAMPADFLADLQTDIAHYDEQVSAQDTSVQNRKSALNELSDAIAAAGHTIDALDAIMHFVFANDKNALLAWMDAKRLEIVRAHRQTAAHAARKAALPQGSELSGG